MKCQEQSGCHRQATTRLAWKTARGKLYHNMYLCDEHADQNEVSLLVSECWVHVSPAKSTAEPAAWCKNG